MEKEKIHILDLDFLDEEFAIASFLIESKEGLILIESGPESTFNHLKNAIQQKGFNWKDVKHVLLTHIHFDHAGAAWKFAENGAKIYVHPIGLTHLENPERLWNSAKMIYKDDMERLWGNMQPISSELLIPVDDNAVIQIGEHTFHVLYTPGHAIHHNAYRLDSIIFTGDVAGVSINHGPVVPPCPPPDIDLKLWKKSIQHLKDQKPNLLYLTHFGIIENPEKHLNDLEKILEDCANWMKPFYEEQTSAEEITPRFMEYTENQLIESGVSEENRKRYEYANPSWMSVAGLLRYWKLKDQGRI